jgi:hypothetical protein
LTKNMVEKKTKQNDSSKNCQSPGDVRANAVTPTRFSHRSMTKRQEALSQQKSSGQNSQSNATQKKKDTR